MFRRAAAFAPASVAAAVSARSAGSVRGIAFNHAPVEYVLWQRDAHGCVEAIGVYASKDEAQVQLGQLSMAFPNKRFHVASGDDADFAAYTAAPKPGDHRSRSPHARRGAQEPAQNRGHK